MFVVSSRAEQKRGNTGRDSEWNLPVEISVPLGWAGRQRDPYIVIPDHSTLHSNESISISDKSPTAPVGAEVDKPVDQGNHLMLALQAGDATALRKLYDLYSAKLYSFTLRIVGSDIAAEDIVQETWVTLYEHRMSYQPTYRFSTWLFTIARRKSLSEIRKRKVRSVVRSLTIHRSGEDARQMDPMQATFCGPDASADGALTAVLVERALARLNPQQREIVLLRDVEGFENEELAKILGWDIKPGALRKRIFDAREAFRRAMIAEGYDG